MKPIIAALSALVLAGCSVFGGKAAEEPAFSVELSEPPFEIRAYGPVVVARTVARGPYREAVGTGFGRLFDYISGANTGAREIAMTAPVLTDADPSKIAMTAPVLTGEEAEGTAVMFVLPEEFELATAPLPTDPSVSLAEIPARRVAVATFSGRLGEDGIDEARGALIAWLAARGEPTDGDWQAAGYNPPWTIPALRRNEVMITLPR
ncbi:MAG: heme-binding protein [Pseudomonadota bacterium]